MMDLLQYTFFQNALLGALFASIACGIIGTYIVTRRLVFITGGLTHASFGGVGIGLYMGISPILSAAIFSVLSAFGVNWLSQQKDMREDSAIAVFWTMGMALGIIFTFLSPGFAPDLSAFLFGNILTVTSTDIIMLAALSITLALFFLFFIHPIIYVAFDREFARSQGIPVKWQSGWMLHPRHVNLHDWCEVYYEGVGWVPLDQSFGLQKTQDEKVHNFYRSGIDAYRLIVNDDYSREFTPKKKYLRSEPYDFQRGELEWEGGNLYFNQWNWHMDVEYK